jgi:hypothetical protein
VVVELVQKIVTAHQALAELQEPVVAVVGELLPKEIQDQVVQVQLLFAIIQMPQLLV